VNPLSSGSSGRAQRALRGVSHAGGWLVRAGRPGGELLVHLPGKLTRGPAGQVSGLLRRDLLSALCAVVAVEELGEVLGLVGVDPDDDPGSPQGSLSE